MVEYGQHTHLIANLEEHLQHMRIHALFISLALIVALGFAWSGEVSMTARAQAVDPDSDFVQISGRDLVYRGETFTLRGTNVNNLPALCSNFGGFNFGSCDIDDIPAGEEDYQLMSELGVNHVRFGLSYNWYVDDREKFFEVLEQHVEWARENNIWLIWHLYTLPGNCYEGYAQHCPFWEDADLQIGLRDFWVDIAEHFKDEPVVIGYSLLNEPTPPGPGWSNTWYDLAQEIRNAIAEVNDTQLVFIMSTDAAIFTRVFDGDNIVYSVHDYAPLSVSHADDDTYSYPGEAPNWDGAMVYWDRAAFAGEGDPAADLGTLLSIDWAEQNNVPLYIGEWGTTNAYSDYIQFILDKADVYTNVFNLNHAHFQWRGNAHQWGMFPIEGELVPHDQDYIDAVATSWEGAVRPDFSATAGE